MLADVLTKPLQGQLFRDMQAFLQNCLRDYNDDLEWQEEQSYAARAAWRVTTTMALGKGVTIWWSNKLQLLLHRGRVLINSEQSQRYVLSHVWSGVSKYYFRGVSKYYFRGMSKYYSHGVSKYYFCGVSKYYFRGVSKYYFREVSKYYFEYKYARQSGVECIGVARKARLPHGVSGKEDRSNMRESIQSENMDRRRALVPSH